LAIGRSLPLGSLGAGAALWLLACELVLPIHETPSAAPIVLGDGGDSGGAEPEAGEAGAGAHLLFQSGFEGDVQLAPPSGCGGGNCEQAINGGSPSWPPSFWQGTGQMQLLVGPGVSGITTATVGNYIQNEIVPAPGPHGATTSTLHQRVLSVTSQGTYDGLTYVPGATAPQSDLYVAHEMKIAEDLSQMRDGDYREIFALFQHGDIHAYVVLEKNNGTLEWALKGQGPGFDDESSDHLPVAGAWLKLEIFWHTSTAQDGRFWLAVEGAKVIDHRGPNAVTTSPLDQIELFAVQPSTAPAEQWIDDVEVWDGFPAGAAPHD
jgi:hypothetical protein